MSFLLSRSSFSDNDSNSTENWQKAISNPKVERNSKLTLQTITSLMTPTGRSRTAADENCASSHNKNQQTHIQLCSPPMRNTSLPNMCNSTGLTPYLNHILEPSKVVKPLQLNRNAITVRSESATKPIVTRLCNNANNSKSNISHPALLETKYRSDVRTIFGPTTMPSRLVGRSVERKNICQFFHYHILKPKTGFLYIHGKPGTGKTALLKEVIRELKPEMKNVAHDIKILTIDCKAIASNTYSKLLHGMGYGCSSDDEDTAIKTLESIVLGNGTKVIYVAILDEVDHLLTKHQGVFDKLAQWSFTQESKLTVIGVTNDVDTSDHLIHKLKAMDCEPKVISFRPNNTLEIKGIIIDRLICLGSNVFNGNDKGSGRKENYRLILPLMQELAIELCARKVSALDGDIRKALDICRYSFEIMEAEDKMQKRRLAKEEEGSNKRRKIMPLQEISLADVENRIAGGSKMPLYRPRLVNSTSSPYNSTRRSLRSHSESTSNIEGISARHIKAVVVVEHVRRAINMILSSPTSQQMGNINSHGL